MLEFQITQQESSSSIPPSRLSSNPKPSPKEHCNYIVLRSGKQLEGPKGVRVKWKIRMVMIKVVALYLVRMCLTRRIRVRSLKNLTPFPEALSKTLSIPTKVCKAKAKIDS